MTVRKTLPAVIAVAAWIGILQQTIPGPSLAAAPAESVVVVITLREQPALTVMSGLRPSGHEATAAARDAAEARLQRAALDRISGLVAPAQQRVSAIIEARGGAVLYRLRGYGAIVARVPRRVW